MTPLDSQGVALRNDFRLLGSRDRHEDVAKVKEAIVDLYLAIKIRSTEELDAINDEALREEKNKLMAEQDSFQVLEYIRSSIEIIMNLKIEDLEKTSNKKSATQSRESPLPKADGPASVRQSEISVSRISVESKNLILQSMKDALLYMIQQKETADSYERTAAKQAGSPPVVYERIIQKLEADIRGHIRLEHEMKIHMDYLEGKAEKLDRDRKVSEAQHEALQAQVESLQDKVKLLRDDRDDKDALARK